MKRRLGALVAAALLGSGSWAGTLPPTTHLLLKSTASPNGLNVLFIGDGFAEDQLDQYRKVVQTFAESLQGVDVFDTYYERFNFYRIDLKDPGGATESLCSPATLEPLNALSLQGDLGPPPEVVWTADLEVQHCWNGGNESILYTSLETEALAFASFVPGPVKAVVIVANARVVAGGAQLLTTKEQTTLVVVGSHVSLTAIPGLWQIDSQAINLFAHELGHALGLLDEYDYAQDVQPPEELYPPCRNVWKPEEAPQSTQPTWTQAANPIPWHGVLKSCCTPAGMVRCQAHKVDGECRLQDVTPLEAHCKYVPATGNPDISSGCSPPTACDAFPGAWEGAFYTKNQGYYRARQDCRMNLKWKPFCEACREYLDYYLGHFGAGATSGPWPEDRCSVPYGWCGGSPPPVMNLQRTDTQ